MEKGKRILISGGGIGGITLAYFLRKNGFTPVVVESAPEFKHIGYLLALNKQIGQKVAEKMSILSKLKEYETLLTNNIISDEEGRLVMRVDASPELHNDNSGIMLSRADLHLVLYDLIKNDVDFRFGTEIASLTQDEYGVDVAFTNGSKDRFDLVIGADGVNSKTRKLVFGEGFEKYLDVAYFAFIIKNRTGRPVAGKNDLKMVRGQDFLLAYHAIGNDEVGGYIFRKETPYLDLATKERHALISKEYGKYDKTFLEIMDSLTDDDAVFHGSFTQIVMPTWSKGRVSLIGDAAHCPTPASGTGASLAMAGGYILAKKLAEESDYKKAFAAYESHMRPYAEKTQKNALGPVKVISGKLRLPYRATNAFLRILPMPLLTFILTKVHSHKLEMPLD